MSTTKEQLQQEVQSISQKLQDLSAREEYRAIDIDLMLEELRTLYERLLQIRQKGGEPAGTSPPPQTQKKEPASAPSSTPQETSEEQPVEPSTTEETPEDPSSKAKKEIQDEYRKRQKIEADLNEMFRQKKTELVDKLQDEPLHDLKKAIGVNERYAFLHVLFEGNKSAYNAALKFLDRCRKKEDAIQFVDELKETYDWEDDKDQQQVVKQLKKLVNRKFK